MLIGRPDPRLRIARFVEHRAGFEPAALRLCRPSPWATRAPVRRSHQGGSAANGSGEGDGPIPRSCMLNMHRGGYQPTFSSASFTVQVPWAMAARRPSFSTRMVTTADLFVIDSMTAVALQVPPLTGRR